MTDPRIAAAIAMTTGGVSPEQNHNIIFQSNPLDPEQLRALAPAPLNDSAFDSSLGQQLDADSYEPMNGDNSESLLCGTPQDSLQGDTLELVLGGAGGAAKKPTNIPVVDAQDHAARKAGDMKVGTNKGRKYHVQERNFWFQLCRMFDDNRSKYYNKQAVFLQHSDSGECVENSNKFRNKMSRWYRKYKEGTLTPGAPGRKRNRPGEYDDVGARLIVHLDQIEATTGVGLSWEQMRTKSREIAIELGRDANFKASSGWLHNTLRKANKLSSTPYGSSSTPHAKYKIDPITPIQAFHHLAELRRYCSESNAMLALDACDHLDTLLREHSAGTTKTNNRRSETGHRNANIEEGRYEESFSALPAFVARQPEENIPAMLAVARATVIAAGTTHAIPTTLTGARYHINDNSATSQRSPKTSAAIRAMLAAAASENRTHEEHTA